MDEPMVIISKEKSVYVYPNGIIIEEMIVNDYLVVLKNDEIIEKIKIN